MTQIVYFPAIAGRPHVMTNDVPDRKSLPENVVVVAALTSKSLLELHNAIAQTLGRKTTNRFSDIKAGQRRTWDQLTAYAFTFADQSPADVEAEQASAAILKMATSPSPEPEVVAPAQVAPEIVEDAPAAPEEQPAPVQKAPKVKREKAPRPALKQDDGQYVFNMAARAGGKFKTIGGRRPELMDFLRKSPTFRELMDWYKPRGEYFDERAFNMATAVTCMCHVIGCGVITEGGTSDGRIIFSEAL